MLNPEKKPASEGQEARALLKQIRLWLWIFFFGLVLAGITAIPLETEMKLLAELSRGDSSLARWMVKVREGVVETNAKYPFMAYGTDWLAFGHFVIALAFIGPLRDPIKNVWVIEFGMIACVLVVPFAMIFGGVRGIPLGWRLIDCSFGVVGFIPLWFCRKKIQKLETLIDSGLNRTGTPDLSGRNIPGH